MCSTHTAGAFPSNLPRDPHGREPGCECGPRMLNRVKGQHNAIVIVAEGQRVLYPHGERFGIKGRKLIPEHYSHLHRAILLWIAYG
jgi:hypothetical protein